MSNYDGFLSGKAFGKKEESSDSKKIKHITVELDDISTFSLNPRRAENPEYENIKESIRAIGLENPLTLTKRPGASGYTLFNGGNTRLRALKELYAETNDDRFRFLDCKLVPYQSDAEMLIRHLVENETRGDMLLVDKALAAYQIKQLEEQESNTTLSARKLSDILCEQGWVVKFKTVSIFLFVAENLANRIPAALNAGMGRPRIEQIRKTFHAIKQYVDQRLTGLDAINGSDAQQFYLDALGEHDAVDIDLNYALDDVCNYISSKVDIDAPRVHFEILYILEHGEIFKEKSAIDGINDIGQKVEPESAKTAGDSDTFEIEPTTTIAQPNENLDNLDVLKNSEVEQIARSALFFRDHIKYLLKRYDLVGKCLYEIFELPYFEISSDSVAVLGQEVDQLNTKINEEMSLDEVSDAAVCIQLFDFLSAYFTVNLAALNSEEEPRRQYWDSLIDDANAINTTELRHKVNAHAYGFYDTFNDEVIEIVKDFHQLAQYSLAMMKDENLQSKEVLNEH